MQEMFKSCEFDLGSGRSPGRGSGNPLQYSCLENPTDRGAWRATIHGVAKSRTQLTNNVYFSLTKILQGWVVTGPRLASPVYRPETEGREGQDCLASYS